MLQPKKSASYIYTIPQKGLVKIRATLSHLFSPNRPSTHPMCLCITHLNNPIYTIRGIIISPTKTPQLPRQNSCSAVALQYEPTWRYAVTFFFYR